MTRPRRSLPSSLAPLVLGLAAACGGCSGDARSHHDYAIEPPEGSLEWQGPLPPIPGRALESYRIPAGDAEASLIVFRSRYVPETTVDQLLTERRNLVRSLPSLSIHDARTLEVTGKPALLFDLTAMGTGTALSPTGLGKPVAPAGEEQVPTRRLWLAVPRGPGEGTLEVFFHAPESAWDAARPLWERILASLRA